MMCMERGQMLGNELMGIDPVEWGIYQMRIDLMTNRETAGLHLLGQSS